MSFTCWVGGCPLFGVPQHVTPPMTGREAWDRHYRNNHLGRNQ